MVVLKVDIQPLLSMEEVTLHASDFGLPSTSRLRRTLRFMTVGQYMLDSVKEMLNDTFSTGYIATQVTCPMEDNVAAVQELFKRMHNKMLIIPAFRSSKGVPAATGFKLFKPGGRSFQLKPGNIAVVIDELNNRTDIHINR